jgi:hypothetical protein
MANEAAPFIQPRPAVAPDFLRSPCRAAREPLDQRRHLAVGMDGERLAGRG